MKSTPFHLPALLAFLLVGVPLSPAQTPTPPAADAATEADATPPPGSTVITSDELRVDQDNHTAVFSGNVLVVGTNFNMRCLEMTVIFTKASHSQVETIIAKGEVVIEQPGRIAHCGEAQYFRDDDKFVLTDEPIILEDKNQISAPEITIYRTRKEMSTRGRTKTTIVQGLGNGGPPPAPENK